MPLLEIDVFSDKFQITGSTPQNQHKRITQVKICSFIMMDPLSLFMQEFLNQQSKNKGEMNNITIVSDNAITPTRRRSSFSFEASKAHHAGATRRQRSIETVDTQHETGSSEKRYMICEGEEHAIPLCTFTFTHQMCDQQEQHCEQEYHEMEHAVSIFSDPRLPASPQGYAMSPHVSVLEEVEDRDRTPTMTHDRPSLDTDYNFSGKNATIPPPPPADDGSPRSIAITPEELDAAGLKSSSSRGSSLESLPYRPSRKTHSAACKSY
jgi:hypothetical protein